MALHTCMLCEAVCGIHVTLGAEGRAASVRGDVHDPFSRGHICPKAAALPDIHDDPDRVRQPMRRHAGGWAPVSWDEALDEAATQIARLQKRHGRSSVALYLGNPTVHSYTALLGAGALGTLLGSRARFSATSLDQLPHMLAALHMFGHQLLLPVPDVDRTDFFLVLGGNPLVSNGSLMTAPNMSGRLKALRARGGKLVVVDPRRSETAHVADQHIFIRPGSDAYLLMAILYVIFQDRSVSLTQPLDGLHELEQVTQAFPPDAVAPRVGIEPHVIRALAQAFVAAPRAVCYGRVGVCTQEFGGLAAWLVLALNAVTGNIDRIGGAMFASPAVEILGKTLKGHFNYWQSRVRHLPEFSGELPTACLAEEIDTSGDGGIRGLITFAGNPVLSAPHGARLARALPKLDFMVSIDLYCNETTRHANLILPTTFGLERDHYDMALYALAVRNSARFVPAVLAPPPGVRHDYEVFCALGERLHARGGGRQSLAPWLALKGLRMLGPRRALDVALRSGPYGTRPWRRGGLSLRHLLRNPHGLDLGPLVPRLPEALHTANKRIHVAPTVFVVDVQRLHRQLTHLSAPASLQLIGRRQLRSNNSWMHNSQRLVKGSKRCTLLMHPADAAARDLTPGDFVCIASRVGQVVAALQITDDLMQGVVSLPHGWGHHDAAAPFEVASGVAGVSINDLTDDAQVDPLSGTAAFSGVPVVVTRATGL